jgi:succinate dehydrogenase / fumarate reductase flavoprotein subunit
LIHEYDVVVVGGGIAGLYTALTAAEQCRVAVVSKVHVTRSHSVAAQGGIAASLGNEEEDHWEWHMGFGVAKATTCAQWSVQRTLKSLKQY